MKAIPRWKIPETWSWVRAREVADVVGGGTPPTKDPDNFTTNGFPWLTPADLSGFEGISISRGSRDLSEQGLRSSSAKPLPPGTVLFSSRAPIGYVAIAKNEVSTNQGFRSFVPCEAIDSKYLLYYLLGSREFIESMASGTTFKELRGSLAKEIPLPIAPLREQHRIVAEIEKYFTRLDAAVAALKRAQANLERYRASILHAACEGCLVVPETQVAEREKRSCETGEEFLDRIVTQQGGADALHLRGVGKSSRCDPKPQAPGSPTPAGWTWTTLSVLSWDEGYGTSQKCVEDITGPPVLRIPNVDSGQIDLSNLKFATQEGGLNADDRLEPGDFLIIRTNGSRNLIGRGAPVLTPFDTPHFFASYLIRFRFFSPLLAKWISLQWQSPQVRSRIVAEAATSAGQYNISLRVLKPFSVLLPPEPEMMRILNAVEERLSIIEEVLRQVEAGVLRADQLRQAILKRAFEGKLVPQDPTEEPAAVLLERVRQEPEAKEVPAKGHSYRTRPSPNRRTVKHG